MALTKAKSKKVEVTVIAGVTGTNVQDVLTEIAAKVGVTSVDGQTGAIVTKNLKPFFFGAM